MERTGRAAFKEAKSEARRELMKKMEVSRHWMS